jgi:tRNA G10  N-methylase Trm11
MNSYLFITGNHRALSVAELFMSYSEGSMQVLGQDFVVMDLPRKLGQKDLDALGGSIKIGKVIPAEQGENQTELLANALSNRYTGTKLDYGVSVYGMPERQLKTILIGLKKVLRAADIKSRFINNNFQNITAAQYKSIAGKGIELLVAKDGGRQWVAETVAMQDIDAYSRRDYGKPFRDMKMGMLPPKLAQILINLTGVSGTLWDPFCGSGVVVMEGLLMGHSMIGSDIHAERVEGAKKNIEWTRKEFGVQASAELFVHDATKPFSHAVDGIASESDLGMPHSQQIRPDMLQKIMFELDQLYLKFFGSLKSAGHKVPVVIALPFFRSAHGPSLDMGRTIESIERLGFKRAPMLPEIMRGEDRFCLKYSRPDQAVGRAIYRFMPA